jgi:hypothetical protein
MTAVTYVLLFYLASYSTSGGMTITTAEFNSKANCEAAGVAADKKFSGAFTTRAYWVCVEK